jgi:hypothetical protein
MRLTLRTLLAYLDDVLDPADKEELSQKIESSEFAEDLVHRTRDTMRRLRLSAPQVIGTGIALDPNTVAEYLDNVLPPDQVGDFERICLESDVHLAEAAACHHVLTMVLGEPADVDPRMRQRMYGIPSEGRERKRRRVEGAHGPMSRGTAKPQAAPSPSNSPAPPANEIPEYLRAGSWWSSRGALSALAVVLLLLTTLYLLSGLTGWFGDGSQANAPKVAQAEEFPDAGSEQAAAPAETGPPAEPPAPLAAPPQPSTPGITPPSAAASPEDRYGIESAASDQPSAPPLPADSAPAGGTATSENSEPAAGEVDRYALPGGEPTSTPPAAEEASAPVPPPTEPLDAPANSGGETAPGEPGSAAAAAAPAVDADAPASEAVDAGPRELGTYLGGKTVLLRYDEAAGAWYRLEPRDAVVSGQRLVSLPEFRPKVTLVSGLHLDISGGTQIVIRSGEELSAEGLPAAGADQPALEVVYGRVVLINTSMAENRVRLKLGPTIGESRLARNATLALEVARQHVAGNDPRKSPSPVLVQLFAPDGGVTWQDASGERTANASSHWTIESGVPSDLIPEATPPEWIDQEPELQTSEQRFGAPVVENALVSNRPVDIQLLELFQASSARREVKSLVTRSSTHVALFEPFVEALRDSEQRPNWKSHIDALRSAMAISPESAEKVYQAFVAQRDERVAGELYEMLCGYNADQIGRTAEQRKSGAIARLIDWLEEDSLDYRVLAAHNLAEITGKRLMSNPAAGPAERAVSVRRWRSRLESDELQPLEVE